MIVPNAPTQVLNELLALWNTLLDLPCNLGSLASTSTAVCSLRKLSNISQMDGWLEKK